LAPSAGGVKENGRSTVCKVCGFTGKYKTIQRDKMCKNYRVMSEFETTILAGLCTVSGRGGRLFKLSLNLNIAYKIKYFEIIFCKASWFQ
jgi:hypothetical protein